MQKKVLGLTLLSILCFSHLLQVNADLENKVDHFDMYLAEPTPQEAIDYAK